MKRNLIIMAIIFGIITILACKGTENVKTKNADEKSNSTEKKEEKAKEKLYNAGDKIQTDKFEISIIKIEERAEVGGEYSKLKPSEGGTYVCVQYSIKNITQKPIGFWDNDAGIEIIDSAKTAYKKDIEASSDYSTEVYTDQKIISDLNPNITVKNADVFEISKESYAKAGWKVHIKGTDAYINIK